MNWEAIGAVGELIGAVAVVVTLLYLAISVRQNSNSIAISALHDATANWNQWSEMLATSDGLADIVVKGNSGLKALTESETLRYLAYMQTFFDSVESYRTLVTEHKIEKDLHVLETIVARRMNNPGCVAAWEQCMPDYDEAFVGWMAGVLAAAKGA